MVYFKVVLAFVLVAVVSGQSVTLTSNTRTSSLLPYLQNALGTLGSSVKSSINLFNTSAHTGTNLVNSGVQGFTSAGKSMVNTASTLKSSALQGGVDTLKQGVDIGTNLAGIIPGMSGFANMGGSVVKAGADVGNMMGQTGISLASAIENGKLELVSGLSNAGAGLAASGINVGVDMANSKVDTGFKMASNKLATVGSLMDNAMNYVNEASGKVSSLASSAAEKMSFKAPKDAGLMIQVI